MKREHIVVSSWLRSRCYISYSCCFLPEYLLPHGLQPREVYHQEVFLRLHASGHLQLLESKKMPRIILNPSVNGSNKSNTVSSTSFSRSKFPLVCENSMDGTALLFANCDHKDKVLDAAFDNFLTFIFRSGSIS